MMSCCPCLGREEEAGREDDARPTQRPVPRPGGETPALLQDRQGLPGGALYTNL